jgi:hypothetical protein
VQLVAFDFRVRTQEMFLGILDIVSCLDTGQRKVDTFGWVVRTWRLLVSHCRPASCLPSPSWAPLIQAGGEYHFQAWRGTGRITSPGMDG